MMIEQVVADALGSIISQAYSDACIWVGLSAGVDSTVLFHAAAHYCADSGKKLKAIHVHHGLSDNADAWAKQAQDLCEELSKKCAIEIECVVERVLLDQYGDGLEQAARLARYEVFSKHCQSKDVLLQGHHLDDQIETFFMRAIRGSGLTGLASIPKQRSLSRENACQILRPLIDIEKTDLLEYANQHQLCWLEDESNQDSKMDRNWWRNELLPQIWQRYPKHKKSLSRTLHNVQHEHDLLQKFIVDKLTPELGRSSIDRNIHPALKNTPRFDLSVIQGFDQATILSYLRAWLAQYVDTLPSSVQMQAIYAEMIHAREDREPIINWATLCLHRFQQGLYLLNSEKKDSIDIFYCAESSVDWQGESLNCVDGYLECVEKTDSFALKPDQYKIRCWKPGDVAKPVGRSTRKLKKWWQDYNVPSWARQAWPVIVNKETDEIAAVPGLFICQGYQVKDSSPGWLCYWQLKSELNPSSTCLSVN